jgi:hypothetical protein
MKPELARAADFSNLLRQRLAELQIHPVTFMLVLRMRRFSTVRSWLEGTALPPLKRIGDIALVLDLCPAETLLVWAGKLDPGSVT